MKVDIYTAHSATGKTVMVENENGGFVREVSTDQDGYTSFTRWPSITSYEAYIMGDSLGIKGAVKVFNASRELVFEGNVNQQDYRFLYE